MSSAEAGVPGSGGLTREAIEQFERDRDQFGLDTGTGRQFGGEEGRQVFSREERGLPSLDSIFGVPGTEAAPAPAPEPTGTDPEPAPTLESPRQVAGVDRPAGNAARRRLAGGAVEERESLLSGFRGARRRLLG